MTRDQLKVYVKTDQGNAHEKHWRVIENSLNILDDGIERIPVSDNNGGYVVISPKQVENQNRHIALKVDDNGNTFWTISASADGQELEIGILENGEYTEIISFDKDQALRLNQPLQLGQGLNFQDRTNIDIDENGYLVVSKINQDKSLDRNQGLQLNQPLQLGQGVTFLNKEVKGIASSGFKGFKQGVINEVEGEWHEICTIPNDTFGKYKVEAWLVSTKWSKEKQNYCTNLSSVITFFPNNRYELDYRTDKSLSPRRKLWFKFEDWSIRIIKKLTGIEENKTDTAIVKGTKILGRGLGLRNRLNGSLKIKVFSMEKGGRKVIKLKNTSQILPDRHVNIYYSIERLWEGKNWLDSNSNVK